MTTDVSLSTTSSQPAIPAIYSWGHMSQEQKGSILGAKRPNLGNPKAVEQFARDFATRFGVKISPKAMGRILVRIEMQQRRRKKSGVNAPVPFVDRHVRLASSRRPN